MNQLSLWVSEFDERIRRIDVDGVTYFSVLDCFQHYGKAKNPTTSWKTAQKRLERQGFVLSREILDRVLPGGRRTTPFATFKTMIRIAQVTDFREWEPLRNWMADVAHERLEELANPQLGVERAEGRFKAALIAKGYTPEQAQKAYIDRQQMKNTRNAVTAVLNDKVTGVVNYGVITNDEYRGLFQRTAQELRERLHTKDIRSAVTPEAASYINLTELAFERMVRKLDTATFDEARQIMISIAEMFGTDMRRLELRLGIDLTTGARLIGAQA